MTKNKTIKSKKTCYKCDSEMIKVSTRDGDIIHVCKNNNCCHVELGSLKERTESVKKEINKHISKRMKQVRGGEK